MNITCDNFLHVLRRKHFLEENINAGCKESAGKKTLKGFENDKANPLIGDPDECSVMC